MSRFLSLLITNPNIFLWLVVGFFAFGVASGGVTAWTIQNWRLHVAQTKFNDFVSTTKAQGEAAQREANAKAKADRQLKESSDREYQTTIAALRTDVKRMRDERTRASFVPASPANSRSPGLACFDRTQLEQALRYLDSEISGLVEEGDADAIGLNAGRRWAVGIGLGKSPDNPANSQP